MQGKIIVITGANSGIGKQTALELAKTGAKIIMVCRSEKRGEAARQAIIKATNNQKVELFLCNLSEQSSIQEAGMRFRANYSHIDVLINNAGAIFGDYQETSDGLERTFALNHMGYFLWTHYLLDLLKKADKARIINVASLAHTFPRKMDWENLQYKYNYTQFGAYGLSKLCNVYFTQVLSNRLNKITQTGITVNCLHPGTISTGFGDSGNWFFRNLVKIGRPFLASPRTGAATSVFLATSPKVSKVTGKYFVRCKEKRTSRLAQNYENAKKLWDISMELGKVEEYGVVNVNEV